MEKNDQVILNFILYFSDLVALKSGHTSFTYILG